MPFRTGRPFSFGCLNGSQIPTKPTISQASSTIFANTLDGAWPGHLMLHRLGFILPCDLLPLGPLGSIPSRRPTRFHSCGISCGEWSRANSRSGVENNRSGDVPGRFLRVSLMIPARHAPFNFVLGWFCANPSEDL